MTSYASVRRTVFPASEARVPSRVPNSGRMPLSPVMEYGKRGGKMMGEVVGEIP
jgi:hypothetical protein